MTGSPMTGIKHLSVRIERPAHQVYDYVRDPRHLPEWAAGLAGAPLEENGDHWTVDSPMGTVRVAFADQNEYGIFDHTVTLPNGETVLNPVRVIPDGGDSCDVLFTVRQRNMTDEQFEADLNAVQADLDSLKQLMETR